MLMKQFYLGCLAHASYIVADKETGIAAVVDPQRDIAQYEAFAKEHDLDIKYVILTHFHADFVAGHLELQEKFGAEIVLGDPAKPEYDAKIMKDGERLSLGNVAIEAMHTPGHTPESTTFLVYDLAKSDSEPHAALTGDTLFIGDVGRPDLLASIGVTADELGTMLYDSIHNKMVKLPDATLVYPAHGAGSLCGKNLSDETVSTIGEQKKYNYAMQPMSEDEFKKIVTANQPPAPQYFVHDAILNRQKREVLDDAMARNLKAMSLDEVLQHQEQGNPVLDVRSAEDFAAVHLKGTLNVGLSGKFATWAGTFLNNEKPIAIIADDGFAEEAVMRLGRIGLDNVGGYLEGGMAAIGDRDDLIGRTQRVTAQRLADDLAANPAHVVLDIRAAGEHESDGTVPSKNLVHIPLNELPDRIKDVPTDTPFTIHCAGGYRSSIGASILQQHGIENFTELTGGFKAWKLANADKQSV